MSDMAGEATRVAVEPSGSERDTMELMGSATLDMSREREWSFWGKRHRRQSCDG